MINILEGNDFINDSEMQKEITAIIKSKLEYAKNKKEFINVSGVRGIGKTQALMSYAIEHGYGVVVNNENLAKILRQKYPNIIASQDDKCRQGLCAVCDENVDLDICKKNNINIITGFVSYNNKKSEVIDNDIYKDVIKCLKEECKKLSDKLVIATNRDDMNLYIATIKSLKETLDLISKYDWQLNYSEYDVIKDDENKQHQVSVWYQNHDNQIKDHKIWNVDGVGETIIK